MGDSEVPGPHQLLRGHSDLPFLLETALSTLEEKKNTLLICCLPASWLADTSSSNPVPALCRERLPRGIFLILVVQGHIVPNFCDLKVLRSLSKDQPTLFVARCGGQPHFSPCDGHKYGLACKVQPLPALLSPAAQSGIAGQGLMGGHEMGFRGEARGTHIPRTLVF